MNEALISEMFDEGGWIKYNKTIARCYGIEAAIVLGNLIDKYNYWRKKNKSKEFFHTREDAEEETGLSAHKQRLGEDLLEKAGLIYIYKKGLPAKNYYSIDFDEIANCLSSNYQSLKSLTTGHQNPSQQELQDFNPNKNKDNKNKLIITTTGIEETEEVDRTTSRKGGIELDVSKVLDAYNLYVDDTYIATTADKNALAAFKYREQLASIIWLWPYFIGEKSFGDEIELAECKQHLTKYEKESTAHIWVIIYKWNTFKKWAKNRQERLDKKEEYKKIMEADKF